MIQSATCFCEKKCVAGWLTRLADLLLTDLAKNPKQLHSNMLLDLVQLFLRAEVSLEFAEISIRQWFLLRYSL